MGVVLTNPHIQEARELESKLRRARNEEEGRVISQELETTQINKDLADSREVRQKNLILLHYINEHYCSALWLHSYLQ